MQLQESISEFERSSVRTDRLRSLFLCYMSLDDPLVHTQVINYVEGLARRGHVIHLVTWEMRRISRADRAATLTALRVRGIEWHPLRYHKRPTVPATAFDVACGILLGVLLILRHRLTAIHAYSHVPAAIGLALARLTGRRLIFDHRGLLAEEYADVGRWDPNGVPYRLTKWTERRAIERAAATVVLTRRVVPHLFDHPTPMAHRVIPCCADLRQLAAQLDGRSEVRKALGIGHRPVMVYVGKFTGWYMEREMVDFFATAREVISDLHFLVLTQSDAWLIERECDALGVCRGDYTVTCVPHTKVGSYLAAADFAISFVRPVPSKVSSSPTKIGEYLGAGLPVVSTARIGDVDELLSEYRAGVLVRQFTHDGYICAAREVQRMLRDPCAPDRCRDAARERLSLEDVAIPRYDELYRFIAESSARRNTPPVSGGDG